MAFIKRFLAVYIVCLLALSRPSFGEIRFFSKPELLRLIEERHRGWLILKASAEIHFTVPNRRTATCQAEIKYQPVTETVLLQCFNQKRELLFAFKTRDDRYEYYAPNQKMLYYGNIFDLEDSPDMESHVKPLHLYQALKLSAISPEHVKIEKWDRESVALKILNLGGNAYVTRKLTADYQGNVPEETYYTPDGKPSFSILRSDYRKPGSAGKKSKLAFPHRIEIHDFKGIRSDDRHSTSSMEMIFKKVSFVYTLKEKEWTLRLPAGTQKLNITQDPWQTFRKGQSYQI